MFQPPSVFVHDAVFTSANIEKPRPVPSGEARSCAVGVSHPDVLLLKHELILLFLFCE